MNDELNSSSFIVPTSSLFFSLRHASENSYVEQAALIALVRVSISTGLMR